jgi:uncharacterized protein YuzE
MRQGRLLESTYDEVADALYVTLVDAIGDGEAVRQIYVEKAFEDGAIVLDVNAKGVIVGMEILGASVHTSSELLRKSRRI